MKNEITKITRRQVLRMGAGLTAALGLAGISSLADADETPQPGDLTGEAQPAQEESQDAWVQTGGYTFSYPTQWACSVSESGGITLTAGSLSTIFTTTIDMNPPTSAVVAEQLVEFLSNSLYTDNTASGKHAVAWLDYSEGCSKGLDLGGLVLSDGRYISMANYVVAQDGCGVLVVSAMTDNTEFWLVMDAMKQIIQTTAPAV